MRLINHTLKNMSYKYFFKMLLLAFSLLLSLNSISQSELSGELKQWHKVSLTFDGPETVEKAAKNPFLNYRLNVTFSNGSQSIVVPGYFAADGDAANTSAKSGNKWRCHFVPYLTGKWTWKVSFREGDRIALSNIPEARKAVSFNGEKGSFKIKSSDKVAPDFRAKGALQYTGEHYFQFAGSKEFFLKGGADSPENFLVLSHLLNINIKV